LINNEHKDMTIHTTNILGIPLVLMIWTVDT